MSVTPATQMNTTVDLYYHPCDDNKTVDLRSIIIPAMIIRHYHPCDDNDSMSEFPFFPFSPSEHVAPVIGVGGI
jgi:hypothetical protein